MASVGIIANPASGKDIRRLVAHSITFSNLEKVNIVKRLILGMDMVGIKEIVYMPDYFGIVPQAIHSLPSTCSLNVKICELDMECTGTQEDSTTAAALMREQGVGCIITLGGDGTNRMVARGCGQTPLLPVSTGTNNVFPFMLEGTTAGMAAAVVAMNQINSSSAIKQTKRIKILKNEKEVDMALVDAVVLKDLYIGSRAVWDEERIQQVVVTRAEPHSIGISAIAGNIQPMDAYEPKGMAITVGPGEFAVKAPIGPGLIKSVPIKDYQVLNINDQIAVHTGPCVIALDGEREIEVGETDQYFMQVTMEGPRVVDVRETLREAVKNGYTRVKTR